MLVDPGLPGAGNIPGNSTTVSISTDFSGKGRGQKRVEKARCYALAAPTARRRSGVAERNVAHPVFACLRGENSPSTERMRRYQTLGPPSPARPRRREEAVQGGRWSVPCGAAAVSLRRSWARVRYLVFGNHGRAEHQRSGGKTRLTNAQRREGLCFRLWAVFPRGRPMNRNCANAGAVRTQAARPGGRHETRHSPLNRLMSSLSTRKCAKTG